MTTNVPRLTQLSPGAGKPGTEVTISGISLSDEAGGNTVLLNGRPQAETPKAENSQVKLVLPAARPDGNPRQPGEVVLVGLICGGQGSANTLPFTLL